MGLREYKRKRDFTVTAEPAGGKVARRRHALSFVVQKHAARRLHYDFRLELDGVLKSWAVPKGPTLVPGEKRLAVQVEDHPIEYADFEGIIPAGEYGGGTVIVWDRGEWTPTGDPHDGLERGNLEFDLVGDKLKGRWRLVRLRARTAKEKDKPAWLLLKSKDAEATDKGVGELVDRRPESVITGRELAAVAAAKDRVWHSKEVAFQLGEVAGARKAALPKEPMPALATLVAAPPDGDEWLHEIKLDGYRLLARLDRGQVALLTRQGLDWKDKFPAIAEAIAALPCRTAVLDGEAVVLDAEGRSSFQELQAVLGTRRGGLVYFAFDLLHVDGHDLSRVPLEARKEVLSRLVADSAIRFCDHVVGNGATFLANACAAGLEGIVSKRREGVYAAGRGKGWLKSKCLARQELIIVGFTDPSGARKDLGALLLGVREGDELVYAGKVGTGFTAASLRALRERLDPLVQDEPTVAAPRSETRGARWVAPKLVAEVKFTEWTKDGRIRHPSFQGLREDKPSRDVQRETPAAVGAVKLSHPDKVLFPDPGITKRELAAYYESVSDYILPGLINRPLTLVRCPEGYEGQCFYQKRANRMIPRSIPRIAVGRAEDYIMLDGLPALLSLVQLGVLELHVWGARAPEIEKPDLMVFDLDPDPAVPWSKVVEVARFLNERLTSLGLNGFPRLTGGKGLHVVVPLAPSAGWDEVKEFTHTIARWLVKDRPDDVTANMAKAKRTGKIFVDYLRNGREATAVASYSTRARAGAPVAMPLTWAQVQDDAAAQPRVLLRDAAKWIAKHGDAWKGFDEARRPLR